MLERRLLSAERAWGGDDGDLTQLIDELADAYPSQLLKLYRRLQVGDLSTARVVAALSTDELGRLVQGIVSVTQQTPEGSPSDLNRAITTYASQVRDTKRYYRHVLECLTQNQVIDFEAIIGTDVSSDDEGLLASQDNGTQPESLPAPSAFEQAEDELVRYLEGVGGAFQSRLSRPSQATSRLVEMFSLLLSQRPNRLRQVLERSLAGAEASARLVDLLPERLLTRTLFLLQPGEHHRIQRCADIIANACYAPALAIRTDTIHPLKWGFIFRYISGERPRFDQAVFAQHFVGYLAEETSQADVAAFRSALIQQLTENILPSTRQQHMAIIDALSPEDTRERGSGEARERGSEGRRMSFNLKSEIRNPKSEIGRRSGRDY